MLRQAVAKQRARGPRVLTLTTRRESAGASGEREAIFARGDHKPCDHPFGREAPVDHLGRGFSFQPGNEPAPSAGSGARRRHDEGGTPTIFLKARLNAASEP